MQSAITPGRMPDPDSMTTIVMTHSAFLAIDASSDACSAALQINKASSIVHHSMAPRQHSYLLQSYVSDLLSHLKSTHIPLAAVIVGYGPGSFAGVRIATAIAQGVAAVYQVPLIGVSSMKSMALHFAQQQNISGSAINERRVVVLNDAKMQEVYIGAYSIKNEMVVVEHKDSLVAYAECRKLIEHWFETAKQKSTNPITLISQNPLWANALLSSKYDNQDSHEILPLPIEAGFPHAHALLSLGIQDFHQDLAVAAEQFEPLYLRQATAWKTLDHQ